MVNGLKFKFTRREIQEHCNECAKYHTNRVKEKSEELPKLEHTLSVIKKDNLLETELRVMNKSGGYSLDHEATIKNLKKDIERHQEKAAMFNMFAAHLVDEDYLLNHEDLKLLGLVRSSFEF